MKKKKKLFEFAEICTWDDSVSISCNFKWKQFVSAWLSLSWSTISSSVRAHARCTESRAFFFLSSSKSSRHLLASIAVTISDLQFSYYSSTSWACGTFRASMIFAFERKTIRTHRQKCSEREILLCNVIIFHALSPRHLSPFSLTARL